MIHLTKAAIRRGLERLLHTHDTPRRTAAAYAAGVFWGYSPLLGLHTILGLVTAFALNLNRVAVLLGVYSNLPWSLAPYYTLATIGGAALLGADVPPGLLAEFGQTLSNFSIGELRHLFQLLEPLLWSYVIGSTIGALLAAAVAYRVSLAFIVSYRSHVKRHDGGAPHL
ncbi:MAG TPA: DUF2062 domain-containing protein [Vicinamibacterales bacterium]|nr:DUF2062 domain-containing protein [Vicinamibacterales bacterium]